MTVVYSTTETTVNCVTTVVMGNHPCVADEHCNACLNQNETSPVPHCFECLAMTVVLIACYHAVIMFEFG